jgi:hypothetical protein
VEAWAVGWFGATPVLAAHKRVHNTSLLPNKQLVRELELKKARFEVFHSSTSSISRCATLLVNKNLPAATVEASTDHSSQSGNHPTMENLRQQNQCRRLLPPNFFKRATWKTS